MLNSDMLVPEVVGAGFDPFRARVAMGGGFLAGCSGTTFEAYGLDLRQWSQWCFDRDLDLFDGRRATEHLAVVRGHRTVNRHQEGGRSAAGYCRRSSA